MKNYMKMALTGAALTCFAGTANAAVTLTATVTAAYTSGVPTADLHKTNPTTKEINDIKLSPQILKGTLNNGVGPAVPVEFFAYCVDIFQNAGAATFQVKTLADYLGNATKTARITALIAEEGAKENKLHDAAVQLAVWELISETQATLDIDKMTTTTTTQGDKYWDWKTHSWKYKTVTTTTTTPNQFWADDVKNGSGVLANTDAFLAGALADVAAGKTTPGLNIFVASSSSKQDFLYWTYTPVPPPPPPLTPVPEPATWALMLLGFGSIGHAMRAKRRNSAVSFG